MKKASPKFIILIIITTLIFTSLSCTSLMKGLTDSLYSQKDIVLVKEGAPSYLLLVEGLIKSNPKDRGYLVTGIQMFTAYSGAFVTDDERKKIFALKTKEWAIQLLETYPAFVKYQKSTDREQKDKLLSDFLKSVKKSDVGNVFWAGNAWIMWILANLDSTEAFIDLPVAKAIIDRIYVLDDKYYYGAPHLYYGVFYAAFPKEIGGDLAKAKKEFDIALNISGDKLLMTKTFYADFYLKPRNDKKSYENTLKEVINADLEKFPEMRLINSITQLQAKEMLSKIDEIFFDDLPVQQ
jgi:hypothetical protein